jgi:lipopolysaccharide heptosyltransferase II
MSVQAWQGARRILCVRLDSLGDVLMCTPAMRALHASLPGVQLSLLTSAAGAALAPHVPELDGAIAYPAPWLKHSAAHAPAADAVLVDKLAALHFDAACIFTSYSQSPLPAALLCYLAGIPLRLACCREKPYGLLTDWLPETEPDTVIKHEVRRQLDLVASIGCRADNTRLSFQLRAPDRAAIAARLDALGIGAGGRFLVLHTGASAASRRYPAALWPKVATLLAERTGLPMLLTGDAHETETVRAIAHACAGGATVHAVAGELSLGELGAAIGMAAAVVSNNTGPAHLAAALGTPLVDLYALTNPQHTPWKVPHRLLFHDVPCRYCEKSDCPQGHHDCLARVAPERVAEAVYALLA